MKTLKSVVIGCLLMSSATAYAGVVHLDLSAIYNIDGVANVGDFSQSSLDQPNSGGNYVFLTQELATNIAGANGDGLNNDGIYGAAGFSPDYRLGYGSNPNGNNVLQFAGNGQRNVGLSGTFSEIHVAAMSGGGNLQLQLQLNYTDGSTLSSVQTVLDWFADPSESATRYIIDNVRDRIRPDHTGYQNSNDPAIFGHRFLVDTSRELVSFDLIATGTSSGEPRQNIFGASAVEVPAPLSAAILFVGLIGMRRFARKAR